jgi:lipoyl(octanoyl) transferase
MQLFPETNWRLLQSSPAEGAWNMAVDEAILDGVRRGESPATLRLYAWEPACFSLGYAQSAADVNRSFLEKAGWHLVRRPTGGRAILHTDELTYSVIGPPEDPRLAGSVLESYRCLSQALLHALHILGIPAEAHERLPENPIRSISSSNPLTANPVCFEVPSNYEITVGGKKLVGSAQARRRNGVLQHGSLPLVGDLTRIVQALALPDEERRDAAERLLAHATTVESVLGKVVSWEQVARAYVQAFEEVLNLQLVPGVLSDTEMQRAETLRLEKYTQTSWNLRRS